MEEDCVYAAVDGFFEVAELLFALLVLVGAAMSLIAPKHSILHIDLWHIPVPRIRRLLLFAVPLAIVHFFLIIELDLIVLEVRTSWVPSPPRGWQ